MLAARRVRALATFLLVSVTACHGQRASGSAKPRVSPATPSPEFCGRSPCRIFASDAAAFRAVLDARPRVLGVGEAHALSGSHGVEPTVRRFQRDLLPVLKGRASDLVVEVMLPNPSCARETEAAREEQKVVTERQAATNKDDYVALANAASALGIRPHPLRPTCDDLSRIAKAGPDAVLVSLEVVTRLCVETLTHLVDAAAAAHDDRLVVAYGGLMHNDIDPRPDHARYSYGPVMREKTKGAYVELDLIVPELIADTPAWRGLPWLDGFDRTAHAREARLLSPVDKGFVILFAGG